MQFTWLYRVFALVALGVVGLAAYYLVPTTSDDTIPSTPAAETPLPLATSSSNQFELPFLAQPTPHPVSLPAFFEKEFDGRDFTVSRVLADNAAYTRRYITYKSGDLTISGIMNVPKGSGPFPVLILNHGFIEPSVYTNGRGLKREQDYLARRGYVVIHPDYRNHAESSTDPNNELTLRLGYTEDVINAVVALQSADLPYVLSDRVGMLGHSMGGGITLNTITAQPDLISAAVLFAPTSLDARDVFDHWGRERTATAAQIIAAYGDFDDSPSFWDNISSGTFFDRVTVPVQIHQGTNDADVPTEWSDRLATALEVAGVETQYHVYPGEPHEFINAWPTVMERTVTFFDAVLK